MLVQKLDKVDRVKHLHDAFKVVVHYKMMLNPNNKSNHGYEISDLRKGCLKITRKLLSLERFI